MRGWAAVVFLLVLASPAIARADEEEEEQAARDRRPEESGFSTTTGLFLFQPVLDKTAFVGSGTPRTGGDTQTFRHLGREIGVRNPTLLALDFRVDYLKRNWEVGAQLFMATHPGNADSATDPQAAAIAKPSSVDGMGGGLHFVGVLPVSPAVSFFAGPDVGIRGFSVPLPGFAPTTCHSRYGKYSCPETADALQPYVQPRIGITWNPVKGRETFGFFITAWAGSDLVPSPSFAGGLSLGWGAAHNRLR